MVVTTWSAWEQGMEELLFASSGQRPDMLLNILECTGPPPVTKNSPAQSINGAEVKEP